MTRLWCSLAAVGLIGSGTPSADPCERAVVTYAQLNARVHSCLAPSEAPMAVEVGSCRAMTQACSVTDRREIGRFLDCVGQLPPCQGGDFSGWRAKYEACAQGVALSPGCTL